ncbi:MAG: response regulator [Methylotenera sp.]|uniref:response regulator transcription factor n=1 Tax=Methylotenera sp. TaxID=2051956 RepID=UPI002488B3A5|nr:response regulator [Methylotenera sp.]MDI1310377.1 response regulator [Methylotenera sp.]
MKLLLVENSPLLRDAIKDMLSGYENISIENVASTKNEAITFLDEMQYDLIIADIELNEGNGFDVVKHTMQDFYAFKPPTVVMLTNHGNSYYKKLAQKLNIKYFYDKSLDFESAIQSIVHESLN